MSDLSRAIAIAAEAHRGQTDKAGEPYVLHPLRVMLAMPSDDGRMAAVLHDVVEDTPWTLDGLSAEGFSHTVITAIDACTRRQAETYDEFIARTKLDPLGRLVKIADLWDNLDPSRVAKLEADPERIAKYKRALEVLGSK